MSPWNSNMDKDRHAWAICFCRGRKSWLWSCWAFEIPYSPYPSIINTLGSEATGRGNTEVLLAMEAYCFLAFLKGNIYILEQCYLGYSRYDMFVCGFFFFIVPDYIRTFTWDKKLEMVVKSTGILGGQGKSRMKVKLLIVSPRYLEASNNCANKATTSPPCRFETLD